MAVRPPVSARKLVRHRDAVGGSWLSEIVPTLPGLALILLGLGRFLQVRTPGVPLALDNMITLLGAIIAAFLLVIAVVVRCISCLPAAETRSELERWRDVSVLIAERLRD